jgi:hypothetical protein
MENERLQFHHPLQQETDPEDHDNREDCCRPQYSDVPPPRSSNGVRIPSDDLSTLTDTTRYATPSTPEGPPPLARQEATDVAMVDPETIAMVDPENVVVLDSEEQGEDGHFVKNTQKVVIT